MVIAITDWVTDVVHSLGYFGVAFLVAVENVFPPIPSEIVLPLAGFTAADGRDNVVLMVVAATMPTARWKSLALVRARLIMRLR